MRSAAQLAGRVGTWQLNALVLAEPPQNETGFERPCNVK